MTIATTTRTAVQGGVSGLFSNLRRNLAEKARRNHAYRTTFNQLHAMTDRDLADIGVSRLQICDVAQEAANRA